MPPSLVSLVVTTYNHERFITEAIDSALAQTYAPIEVIVVDDGSTDRTPELLAAYGNRIRNIRQTNGGVASSRNRGIREAAGDLIVLLDGDDRSAPARVARHVDAYLRFPEAGLIVNDGRYVDDHTVLKAAMLPAELPSVVITDGPLVLSACGDDLIRQNFIGSTSLVSLPRRVLDEVGPSNPKYPVGSDYDLYLRVTATRPIVVIREVLTDYRYVATSASGRDDRRFFTWTWETLVVLTDQARTAAEPRRSVMRKARAQKIQQFARFAYYYGTDHDAAFARRYLRSLLTLSGGNARVAMYLAALYLPGPVRRSLAPLAGTVLHRDSE
jgi:glycosyltransferase involved in cell wall biosynthesis